MAAFLNLSLYLPKENSANYYRHSTSSPNANAMKNNTILEYISNVLEHMPADWLNLTTHRLDIYDESQAKAEFTSNFAQLAAQANASADKLAELPTAYDYIRLGHPLSCVLEWATAQINQVQANQVISFSSTTIGIQAILRSNKIRGIQTRILHTGDLPSSLDISRLRKVYGYAFETQQINAESSTDTFQGSTILVEEKAHICKFEQEANIDFYINYKDDLGSILLSYSEENEAYISEIQHVRRRETIAMTPINCLAVLKQLVGQTASIENELVKANSAQTVRETIQSITDTTAKPLVASSGLSIQYAIMMGLVEHAQVQHPGKAIRFIVPTNCYGGTNDQARRVAEAIENVAVLDLHVDGGSDMVQSIEKLLNQLATEDAIPYIIAEIPTNPRVEVPDLNGLRDTLAKARKTPSGTTAIDPVFILDQTFCPNINFLGEGQILSSVRSISYASGSKFPSAGQCTAGYCVANQKASALITAIETHLLLCDNQATAHQMDILAKQLPTMLQRIKDAYTNTRAFVRFIEETLPEANINFVSEELAEQGFTPSVFSMDLPTKGSTPEERETYKRSLNLKLINMMITEIPAESKFCVSYGQLKGCYWTVPATSTQGTTKEGDKDYIVRVSVSPNLDFEKHKSVFQRFVQSL